ncbi:GNAT family N-acetyltransferase [Maritalea mediterranea]|uniref:GNAT family N-acetyltransferase n=1 Tax=Maritalea mediterranea TaxID=2909667 RepID=A0ABS9EEX7_9HYPH|nr:GNAT family N-acetyltransferase [Maritalea mediterranea]MCF4099963.1 GNAT family N-acetyltransferase [Maritalea mediterranea]
MENSVIIRAFRDPDWPAICAIHNAARKVELRAVRLPDHAYLPLQKSHIAEGFLSNRIIVAECPINNEIKGFAAFRPRELTWLYVAPNHFGEGVGQRLISYILETTERPLDVQMLDGNKRAQRLYENMGFRPLKRTRGKIRGQRPVSAIGLTLRLTD